jgi:hypothetical protein
VLASGLSPPDNAPPTHLRRSLAPTRRHSLRETCCTCIAHSGIGC